MNGFAQVFDAGFRPVPADPLYHAARQESYAVARDELDGLDHHVLVVIAGDLRVEGAGWLCCRCRCGWIATYRATVRSTGATSDDTCITTRVLRQRIVFTRFHSIDTRKHVSSPAHVRYFRSVTKTISTVTAIAAAIRMFMTVATVRCFRWLCSSSIGTNRCPTSARLWRSLLPKLRSMETAVLMERLQPHRL